MDLIVGTKLPLFKEGRFVVIRWEKVELKESLGRLKMHGFSRCLSPLFLRLEHGS